MRNFVGVSGYALIGARILPFAIALLACLIWASTAQAQTAPFNSQYGEPPTSPPGECADPGDPGSSNSGADPSGEGSDPAQNCELQQVESSESSEGSENSEGAVSVLPTTGGVFLAPLFLGLAAVGASATVAVRRVQRKR